MIPIDPDRTAALLLAKVRDGRLTPSMGERCIEVLKADTPKNSPAIKAIEDALREVRALMLL